VLLVSDEILMPAEYNVALLASANIEGPQSRGSRLGIFDSSHKFRIGRGRRERERERERES
jgi:hypothetical protein